jgi:pimeloyl-ACP methyl ester carboxylesterase
VPTLWLFGGGDHTVLPIRSVDRLRAIKQTRGKDWTIIVFPGAGHGLFDEPPTDPRAAPTAETWVRDYIDRLH